MGSVTVTCRLNMPELLDLPDVGLDDADVDGSGNLYISDGANGRVYKFRPSDGHADVFSVIRPVASSEDEESSLNLAVLSDSELCLADVRNEVVVRYNEHGNSLGEFPSSGVVDLCRGPDGLLYVLSSSDGTEKIHACDQFGSLVNMLPAPARYRSHLDPGLANMDSDRDGNVFVSYGMPPYRIWKVKADGSDMLELGRAIDYPEDAILVADIAVDPPTGVLWVLLACRQSGLQVLDAFSPSGEFIGSVEVPRSDTLYGIVCSADNSELYLLDTGTGPGSGDILRIAPSL